MPYLDVDEIERRLFADVAARGRLERDFGLPPTRTSREFGVALVHVMGQFVPAAGSNSPSPAILFAAAVRALGSNSRRWTRYLRAEGRIREVLGDFDPAVAAVGASRPESVGEIASLLGGQTGAADAKAMLRWADLLAVAPGYGTALGALRDGFQQDGASVEESVVFTAATIGRDVGTATLPPPGAASWKAPGMGPVLASEFLRNLGWPGFKPDRHVVRLLGLWVPDVVDAVRPRASTLASSLGSRANDLVEFLTFALVGLAVTPPGRGPTEVDNLVWALGSYVETKRRGVRTPHPLAP